MDDLEQTIHTVLRELAELRGLELPALANHLGLTADLGLKSLDMAHLVALLEARLQADPFVKLVPITSVRTVGDLIDAYRRCISNTAPQTPGQAVAQERRQTPPHRAVRQGARRGLQS